MFVHRTGHDYLSPQFHIFICDDQRIVFEAVADSEIASRPVISRVLAVGERVVLTTELELFFLDLGAAHKRLTRVSTVASDLIDQVDFDGAIVKILEESGNVWAVAFM